jgi:hypothetical protein
VVGRWRLVTDRRPHESVRGRGRVKEEGFEMVKSGDEW